MTHLLSAYKLLPHKEMLPLGNLWKVTFAYDLHRYGGAANDRRVIWLFLHIMAIRQLCEKLLVQNVHKKRLTNLLSDQEKAQRVRQVSQYACECRYVYPCV